MCFDIPFDLIFSNTDFEMKMKGMLRADKECEDKTCHLEFVILEDCVIFSKSVEKPFCSVPCNMTRELCKVEIFHDVQCPEWTCHPKTTTSTTTTPSTTSPSVTTTKPPIPPVPQCWTDLACISSLSMNVVFALILVFLLALYLYKKIKSNRRRRFVNERTPILGDDVPPSIANENERFGGPSLSRFFTQHSEPRSGLGVHYNVQRNRISFEDIPLLASSPVQSFGTNEMQSSYV